MATPSVEDYIKAIYKANHSEPRVTTHELAEHMHVSCPAVSKMIKRLTLMGLANHLPYHGVELTEAGQKMALETIRHHRLLERYLTEALGYSWEDVHIEAERLEHHISEAFEDRIDTLLGHPSTCPHGDPIPSRDGVLTLIADYALSQQECAAPLTIRRVRDTDTKFLRYLKEFGLLPGTTIDFVEQEPFGGAYIVLVEGKSVRVAPQAAQQIFVTAVSCVAAV